MIKDVKYEDVDWRVWLLYKKPILTHEQFDEWMASTKTNFFSKVRPVDQPVDNNEITLERERVRERIIEFFGGQFGGIIAAAVDIRTNAEKMKDKEFKMFAKDRLNQGKSNKNGFLMEK
jgi:hypothetical protein